MEHFRSAPDPPVALVKFTQAVDSISGSAVLTSTGNVSGFAIFRNVVSGQEAVVPLETRNAAAYIMAYDNTNGRVTGLAVANGNDKAASLTVVVRDDQGVVLQSGPLALAAHGHTAVVLPSGYTGSAGKRGTVEIDGPAGFSALGLFVTPTGNVTTLPVLARSRRSRPSSQLCDTGLFMLRSASHRLGLVLLVWMAAPGGSPQTQKSTSFALPAKETLNYTIEWRLITAGKARLSWAAQPGSDRPGWLAGAHLESSGLVSKLFKVEDDYTATLRQDLCAVSSQMTANEGRRHRETKVTFDAESRKAQYLERDTQKNTVVLAQDIDIPSCVHDVLGGLYLLRTLALEPGQSAEIPMSDGKKSVRARVEAQQREDIKTPSGTYKTIRYEAFLFNNVLYKRPAHLYFWLSEDRRRLPVQIRVRLQFTIGTITFQLEKSEES